LEAEGDMGAGIVIVPGDLPSEAEVMKTMHECMEKMDEG
jgi:hypothetical protein